MHQKKINKAAEYEVCYTIKMYLSRAGRKAIKANQILVKLLPV
jgi:hypothetical protein